MFRKSIQEKKIGNYSFLSFLIIKLVEILNCCHISRLFFTFSHHPVYIYIIIISQGACVIKMLAEYVVQDNFFKGVNVRNYIFFFFFIIIKKKFILTILLLSRKLFSGGVLGIMFIENSTSTSVALYNNFMILNSQF